MSWQGEIRISWQGEIRMSCDVYLGVGRLGHINSPISRPYPAVKYSTIQLRSIKYFAFNSKIIALIVK